MSKYFVLHEAGNEGARWMDPVCEKCGEDRFEPARRGEGLFSRPQQNTRDRQEFKRSATIVSYADQTEP